MPHVIVKLWPGNSEKQKKRLADAIVKDVMEFLSCGEQSVSVGIEEVAPDDWAEEVFEPEINQKRGTLYKKPGYTM
jgi:4-oxalocrotonate tautomerase